MGIEANLVKAALWCIGCTLVWAFISIGLYAIEGNKSYFVIQAVLCFKIILAAVIFLSRYLLFAQYRHEKWLRWLLGICFFVALGGQCPELLKAGISKKIKGLVRQVIVFLVRDISKHPLVIKEPGGL